MRNFAQLLSSFLLEYAPRRINLSTNTIKSYRDTFVLLLKWLDSEIEISPDKASMDDLSASRIEGFCGWLERTRNASPATINVRLAAIRSFANYASFVEPAYLDWSNSIKAIRFTKSPSKEIDFLSPEAIGAIMKCAEGNIRDLALLALLYDSGARVTEISTAACSDLKIDRPASMRLVGKGSKVRVVPLCDQSASIGRSYLSQRSVEPDTPLFCNRSGNPIGRAGIAWVLAKYVTLAHKLQPECIPAKVHPHQLRHSKAVHLLEAGVNLIYIRDFLGHSSVTTTEIYARASTKAKREAIDKASANVITKSAYTEVEKSELIEWLKELL